MNPNNTPILDAELDELRLWLAVANQPYAPRFKAARQDAYRMVTRLAPALLLRLEAAERERDRLKRRDEKLTCLEAGGVDNWDGYDFAMEDYNQ